MEKFVKVRVHEAISTETASHHTITALHVRETLLLSPKEQTLVWFKNLEKRYTGFPLDDATCSTLEYEINNHLFNLLGEGNLLRAVDLPGWVPDRDDGYFILYMTPDYPKD